MEGRYLVSPTGASQMASAHVLSIVPKRSPPVLHWVNQAVHCVDCLDKLPAEDYNST